MRGLYNCVVFLNQLQLSRDNHDDEPDNANRAAMRDGKKARPPLTTTTSLLASLINTYLHLFEMTVKKEEANKKKQSYKKKKSNSLKDSLLSLLGMKSRLLSALLTGINRAHPYLPKKDAVMEQRIGALYWI